MTLSYRACMVAVSRRLEWGSRSEMKYELTGDGGGGFMFATRGRQTQTGNLSVDVLIGDDGSVNPLRK